MNKIFIFFALSMLLSSCTVFGRSGCVKTRRELLEMANKLSGINFSAEDLGLSDADLEERLNLNPFAKEGYDYEDVNGNEITGSFLWKNRGKSVVLYCKHGIAKARRLS